MFFNPSTRLFGRKRSKFLSIRYIASILTISIQTVLLSFLWVFFGVTSRSPVALPDPIARAMKVNVPPVLNVDGCVVVRHGNQHRFLIISCLSHSLRL
jgi:hypothetical protein